jgi:hypothetical protein
MRDSNELSSQLSPPECSSPPMFFVPTMSFVPTMFFVPTDCRTHGDLVICRRRWHPLALQPAAVAPPWRAGEPRLNCIT